MNSREQARAQGEQIRAAITGTVESAHLPADLDHLISEVVFKGIWGRPGLATRDRMICTLAALCAQQRLTLLRSWTGAALDGGLSAQTIQEICLHVCYYIGVLTLDETLGVVREVCVARGVPLPAVTLASGDLAALAAEGERVKNTLHAASPEQLPPSEGDVVNALFDLAAPYGYGEMWTRPGLDFREHALVSIASFTVLRMERQLSQFIQSGLRLGLRKEEVIEAIVQTGPYGGFPVALQGLRIFSKLLSDGTQA